MGSIADAFVPGAWAADVMLAESDWAMQVCVGTFGNERHAEQAANRATPTLVMAGDLPGVAVTVDGLRSVLTAEDVQILVLTAEARVRREHRASQDVSTRSALIESDYEGVWDNVAALALLLAEHGMGYMPRQVGVAVRWQPLNRAHEDELTEIMDTGEELPDSLREDLLFEAITDHVIACQRRKD